MCNFGKTPANRQAISRHSSPGEEEESALGSSPNFDISPPKAPEVK